MWADNETDEDLLGFEVHANLIYSIVSDIQNLPVTVGLFGDWGSGKSSVLKILKNSFESDKTSKKHLVIYFDSWIFEGYEDAKTAILTSILSELTSNTKLSSKIADEAKSLLKRIRWMKLAKIGIQAGASIAFSNPLPLLPSLVGSDANITSSVTSEDLLAPKEEITYDIRAFRNEFSEMLKKTDLSSIVVLVDDLDRCSPERIIENLEAIKLFLNVPGMAFVIAADRRIVEDAIRVRYSSFLSSGSIGLAERQAIVVDYLEKLIQIPYALPKLSPNEVRNYLSLLLVKKIVPAAFKNISDNYQKFLRENRHERYDIRKNLNPSILQQQKSTLDHYLNLVDSSSEPITEGLKGNPRQVKRFLNALWIRQRVAEVSQINNLNHAVLIKLMVLEYINGDLFGQLYKLHKQSGNGTVKIFEEIEKNVDAFIAKDVDKKWSDPSIVRWLKAEPKLANIDLRDYFWISRSSLEDSLVGLQVLSIAARKCIEQYLVGNIPARKSAGALFANLDPAEKRQVISSLQTKALSNPDDAPAIEALFSLATIQMSDEAAEAVQVFYDRVDLDKANLKMANALASSLDMAENSAVNRIKAMVRSIRAKPAKFAVALDRAANSKKQK